MSRAIYCSRHVHARPRCAGGEEGATSTQPARQVRPRYAPRLLRTRLCAGARLAKLKARQRRARLARRARAHQQRFSAWGLRPAWHTCQGALSSLLCASCAGVGCRLGARLGRGHTAMRDCARRSRLPRAARQSRPIRARRHNTREACFAGNCGDVSVSAVAKTAPALLSAPARLIASCDLTALRCAVFFMA